MTARHVLEDSITLINESEVDVVLDEILRNGYDGNMLDDFHSPTSRLLPNLLPIESMYLYWISWWRVRKLLNAAFTLERQNLPFLCGLWDRTTREGHCRMTRQGDESFTASNNAEGAWGNNQGAKTIQGSEWKGEDHVSPGLNDLLISSSIDYHALQRRIHEYGKLHIAEDQCMAMKHTFCSPH